ncbi:MAG: hypothetical protein QM613_03715 [Micrococcaceae bacterium]
MQLEVELNDIINRLTTSRKILINTRQPELGYCIEPALLDSLSEIAGGEVKGIETKCRLLATSLAMKQHPLTEENKHQNFFKDFFCFIPKR